MAQSRTKEERRMLESFEVVVSESADYLRTMLEEVLPGSFALGLKTHMKYS